VAVLFEETFDALTLGQLSSTPAGWSIISASGPTVVNSPFNGKAISTAAGTVQNLGWYGLASSGTWRARFYWKWDSGTLSANHQLAVAKSSGNTLLGVVSVRSSSTAGQIWIAYNSAAPAAGKSSKIFSPGESARIELEWNSASGYRVHLFYGSNIDGTTPDETLSNLFGDSAGMSSTTPDRFFVGNANVSTGMVAIIDQVKIHDSTSVVGPYYPVPTLTGVSPNTGPSAGGTSVALTGTGFLGVTGVTFGGTNASSYTVNSTTSITASTPAKTAGAVDVAVTTPGGTATSSGGFTFSAPPPAAGASVGLVRGLRLSGLSLSRKRR